MTTRLQLRNVSKSFGEQQVLSKISFEDDISTMALIGPSGGGKSTLLKIIGGLEAPDSGEVVVGEQTVNYNVKGLPAYRSSLGFVFQHAGLFAHLSAEENIALPLRVVHGRGVEEARERAGALLNRFGLNSIAQKRPAQLSGGERQRVAIARAVAPSPRLLLLDEPTSALDPEYTAEVLDLINDLKNEGTQFLIVTHEMGFARRACDTVAFLTEGKIAEYGLSQQIFTDPETVELRRFLGRLSQWS
ncbi:amino acid ABC transporter ATP-binding protein [Actinomyces minihominis]|uniref:amino acid ABC transporter ATP-binding protein n=1 Tax=Actinomyces minihominis TaxID=2002838 RepID=UPI000C079E03|nr:amino acid ABC transporter ATP-binding protein [Actinomyces minihominis]